MLFLDGEVGSITRRQPSMSEDNLLGTLGGTPRNVKHLIDDADPPESRMRTRSVFHFDLRQHAVDVARGIIESCCGADDFELLADPAHRLTAMCLSERLSDPLGNRHLAGARGPLVISSHGRPQKGRNGVQQ
jgi:hypothetical protein